MAGENNPVTEVIEVQDITPNQATWNRIKAHRGLQIGFGILSLMALCALAAPLLAPYDPYDQVLSQRLIPPVWTELGSWDHLLGTDHLGRDYLSRLLFGTRISLLIGLGAAAIGGCIGVTLGVLAGYLGGKVDQAINFILTCKLALPNLLITMALVFLIGPSVKVVIFIIGAMHWTFFLVVSRAATLRVKELDYIASAEAIGCNKWQIIWHEIIPNLLNQIIVVFTLEVGVAILSEAALSFLGLGVPAPIPSWGLMIAEGKAAMFYQPWLVIIPGIALFILVVSINLLGDGARDVTAPEHRS